jgi:hypothetical protein
MTIVKEEKEADMWSDTHDHVTQTTTGHVAVDPHLERIGKVTDVLYDDRGTPRWAVLRTGLMRGERLVPFEQVYVDEDGRVVLSIDKRDVRRAPRARRDHVLTLQVRRALRDYYGTVA